MKSLKNIGESFDDWQIYAFRATPLILMGAGEDEVGQKKRGRRWGYGGSRGGRKGLFDFGGGNEAKRRPRKMDSEDGERKKRGGGRRPWGD